MQVGRPLGRAVAPCGNSVLSFVHEQHASKAVTALRAFCNLEIIWIVFARAIATVVFL